MIKNYKLAFIMEILTILVFNLIAWKCIKSAVPYTGMCLVSLIPQFMIIKEVQSEDMNINNIHKLLALANLLLLLGALSSILYSMEICAYVIIVIMCIFAISHLFILVLACKLCQGEEGNIQ